VSCMALCEKLRWFEGSAVFVRCVAVPLSVPCTWPWRLGTEAKQIILKYDHVENTTSKNDLVKSSPCVHEKHISSYNSPSKGTELIKAVPPYVPKKGSSTKEISSIVRK
jgi:hypothetical protein